jgi:hypothetical protein
MLKMALRSLLWRVPSHVTRWPSGWNVDRQKRDYEDEDRIKRDFREVETPTPPLLYSLLVHDRSPSVVNRPADPRTISVPLNGLAGLWGSRK